MSDNGITFSFAGCGFLGIYQIGVASCLHQQVPHLLENAKFAGASAGAIIACCLICDVPMDFCVDFTLRLAKTASKFPLGGWEPNVDIEGILRKSVECVLPDDAHLRCTNRLFVSVSKLNFWVQNKVISEFETRKDLIDVLMCSAFIPGFSAYALRSFKGEYLLDGGLTDNMPVFDSETITISPWAGEHSICPRDPQGQAFPITLFNTSFCPSTNNFFRFADAFQPPSQETLKNYCWQGHDDAIRFLSENDLIHCNIHRVLTHLTHLERRQVYPVCDDCNHLKDHAHNSSPPESILKQWTEEDGEEAPNFPRDLILVPLKRLWNIWTMPISMIKEYVMQLYLLAFFKGPNMHLSEEWMKFLRKLRHPMTLLFDLLFQAAAKAFFLTAEYLVRVQYEVFEGQKPISWAARVALRRICKKCGERVDKPPGVLSWMVGKQQRSSALEAEEGRGPGMAAKAKCHDAPVVVDIPADEAEVSQEGIPPVAAEPARERLGDDVPDIVIEGSLSEVEEQVPPMVPSELSSNATVDMAISLDIKAHSVKVAIPIQSEDGGSEKAEARPQTVCVDSVGEIEEVSIEPVGLTSQQSPSTKVRGDEMASNPNAGSRTVAGKRELRVDRIHKYVHKFEQYKKVMTLHYTDENNVRHTESLFMELEEPLPDFPAHAETSAATEEAAESEDLVKDIDDDEEGARAEEPVPQDVVEELKQLLEEKVLKPQREFDKQYQKVHQKHLKINKQTELLQNTGHFSLQVISYSEELPSPVLSRSSSIRNVSLDDSSNLVRSTSEASSLAGDIRALKERLQRRKYSLKEKKEDGRTQGNLAASRQYSSLQSLPTPPSAALVKSQSDTSSIARALHKMRQQDSSASDGQTLARWRGSKIFRAKTSTPETHRNARSPLLLADSTPTHTATESKSSAATTISTTPCLPNIPDVLTPYSSSDSEPESGNCSSHQSASATTGVSSTRKPSAADGFQPQDKTSKLSTTQKMGKDLEDSYPAGAKSGKPVGSQLQGEDGKPSSAAGDGQSLNGKNQAGACTLDPPSPQQKLQLVRSRSVRKSKTEMSNLLSSLKDLKSEDNPKEEENHAH